MYRTEKQWTENENNRQPNGKHLEMRMKLNILSNIKPKSTQYTEATKKNAHGFIVGSNINLFVMFNLWKCFLICFTIDVIIMNGYLKNIVALLPSNAYQQRFRIRMNY